MADFSGVQLKVERAREHYEQLKSAVETVALDFATSGVVIERDPARERHIWRVQIDPNRLAPLSLPLGDFVHNLRTALDHIVWELTAEKHRKDRPLPEFPIYLKPDSERGGLPAIGHKKVWSLPAAARDLIERVQPYQNPHWDGWQPQSGIGAGNPLARLHDLDNADKHRNLVPTAWLVAGHHGFGPDDALDALVVHRGPHGDGSIIAELPFNSGYSPGDFTFKSVFEVAMAEDQWAGVSVVTFCADLYYRIGIELVPAFKPFFAQ